MVLAPRSRPQLVLLVRLVVTLVLVAYAFLRSTRDPGLSGVVIGLTGGYWLPSRTHPA